LQAGSETTSNFLTWLLIYMINYPEMQQRAQDELDQVVGKDNLPTLSQKDQLNYVQAVIYEVLRHSNIAPFSSTVHNSTFVSETLLSDSIFVCSSPFSCCRHHI
jgi:cytochrome P450